MSGMSPAAASAVSEAKAGRGQRLSPAVNQELRSGSGAPGAPPAAAAASTWSLPTPDLSSISLPGNSVGEKALVVLGILVLGLFFYSRVTGKPIFLGLAGPSAGSPSPLNPSTVGGAAPSPASMARRIAAVNPGKVA